MPTAIPTGSVSIAKLITTLNPLFTNIQRLLKPSDNPRANVYLNLVICPKPKIGLFSFWILSGGVSVCRSVCLSTWLLVLIEIQKFCKYRYLDIAVNAFFFIFQIFQFLQYITLFIFCPTELATWNFAGKLINTNSGDAFLYNEIQISSFSVSISRHS